jgi:pimeloyl-ACP methyl ester carboxylesterase
MAMIALNKDFDIHYEIVGEGETIICIHGNRDSSDVFRSISNKLKDSFRVITFDLRGHGNSVVTEGFTVDDLVQDLVHIMDTLKIKKASLIGHSLGSSIATIFASTFPEKVNKLVLISAASTFTAKLNRPQPGTHITPKIVAETNKRLASYFFTLGHEDVQEYILDGWSRMPPSMHEIMIQLKHPNLLPYLKNIKQPVLLLCGQDDKVTSVEQSLEINNLLIKSRLLVIPRTGHFVFLEADHKIIPPIISFLKGLFE